MGKEEEPRAFTLEEVHYCCCKGYCDRSGGSFSFLLPSLFFFVPSMLYRGSQTGSMVAEDAPRVVGSSLSEVDLV